MRTAVHAMLYLDEAELYEDDNGVDCYYHQLSDTVGLKTYGTNKTNIGFYCYTMQKLLHAHGLAPDCWGFSEKDGNVAFFTEHVTIAGQVGYCEDGCDDEEDDMWYLDSVEDLRREICRVLDLEPIKDIDYNGTVIEKTPYMDLHEGNVGIINGRFVVIDVGFIKTKKNSPLKKYTWRPEKHWQSNPS